VNISIQKKTTLHTKQCGNTFELGLKTNCDSLRGFKTSLNTYLFRQDYNNSQCHSAPQITVISLELWRFINYITYLLRCDMILNNYFIASLLLSELSERILKMDQYLMEL